MTQSNKQTITDTVKYQASSTFEGAKFLPPNNKQLLFIGQDSDTISEYIAGNPEDNIEAITLYTTLKTANPAQALPAVYQVANWQAGDVSFEQSLSESPNAALAIGLALDRCNDVDHAQKIADGEYDESITLMNQYFASIAPRKVFLRIGYEFDGAWNCYSPESYKKAFIRISNKIAQANLDNVATVWQSAAWPDPTIAGDDAAKYDFTNPEHLNQWYPGDQYVDWVSLSVFYRDLTQWNYEPKYTPDFAQQQILDFAKQHKKPVMIAEAAPQGYRTSALTHSYIQLNEQTPITAEALWDAWYQPFFNFVKTNQDIIRAVAYINTNWESQPMWYCAEQSGPPATNCANGNWGDSRVQANPLIKQKWLDEVNDAQRWIQTSEY
ncbi:hypothetical protein [Shewanella sp. ENK2]|uniref:hypothetical protein n=1 Tax=Shewanella sp. ENK2 TaxID=2775245 RepID=UPI0037484C1C